jgi:aspartyl-tRNA(Asn)/glutamyl-tRNA(Gln) amidotransferase subunit A
MGGLMTDILQLTATELGNAIDKGDLGPVEITKTYLDAITAHPLSPRIYSELTQDRAMAEAKDAEERARLRLRRSSLDGVPISWKDLYDTAGIKTEAGSLLLKGRVPCEDALVLKNATAMGAVCLGKTHMSELAFSGLGLNPRTATSPCIHDKDAVSGGSSSGAAASVAYGLAPVAIGSDTGGSVRIPSVWNDLVGLKTTSGRLSLKGVVPLCARFDTVGPLTKTVADAAHVLAVLEGRKAIDMTPPTLKGRRLAILKTVAMSNLRDGPQTAFEGAVKKFNEAGAEIIEIEVPEVEKAFSHAAILFAAEAYGTWGAEIEANPDLMFGPILERFRGGADFKAADFVAAWQDLEHLRLAYLSKTAGFDAVILPTAPSTPPNIERLLSDDDYYLTENLMALRNTRIGNLMGLCALTLPTGIPSCGVMLMGHPMQEERLLRLGFAAEEALG